MPAPIEFTLNHHPQAVEAEPDTPLLYVLRNDFGLTAVKFGCGLAQCGACTVLIDGRPQPSCDVPLWSIAGKSVVTHEGLAASRAGAALRAAFVAEQAAQCGYCIPGIMVAATALLERDAKPSETQIHEALSRNLCRCGTHVRILRAIRRAAEALSR